MNEGKTGLKARGGTWKAKGDFDRSIDYDGYQASKQGELFYYSLPRYLLGYSSSLHCLPTKREAKAKRHFVKEKMRMTNESIA